MPSGRQQTYLQRRIHSGYNNALNRDQDSRDKSSMIREFDLDAPTLDKSKRLTFRNETRCVSSLLERCYSPSKETGKPWKVLVEVENEPPSGEVKNLLGVLTTKVEYDVSHFFRLGKKDKKSVALELLMRGVKQVTIANKLDFSPFEEAAEKVRELSFVNEQLWGKPIVNESNTLSAELLITYDVEAASLSVRFADTDGREIDTLPLLSDKPNEFIMDKYFGRFSWTDEKTVELATRDGQKKFVATLNGEALV